MFVLCLLCLAGMYHHSPPSGLESGKASITDFYRPDEVKYHGKGNRGVVSMNFFGELFDQFEFPFNKIQITKL